MTVKADDIIYWVKVFAGVLYGYASALLSIRLGSTAAPIILLAIAIYVALSEILGRVSHANRRRRYLNGVGGYAGAFLVSWILFYNLLLS